MRWDVVCVCVCVCVDVACAVLPDAYFACVLVLSGSFSCGRLKSAQNSEQQPMMLCH